MARTRRSPKVVWLPPDVTVNESNPSLAEQGITFFDIEAHSGRESTGGPGVAEIPIVTDATSFPGGTNSLSDVENSGYRLRRIVGKIFVLMPPQGSAESTFDRVMVTAGIIIRRTGIDGINSLAGAEAGTSASIETGNVKNWADPWIWRRSWLLSNNQTVNLGADAMHEASSNYLHGPAAVDGPHVDQKTARIVGPEERLFLDVQAVSFIDSDTRQNLIHVWTDLRVLASMRTTVGNRRNASR